MFRDNTAESRFELDAGGRVVFADYSREGDVMAILHVETPQELRGQGLAGRLMKEIMEKAAQDNLRVKSVCPYAASWIRLHREYHTLL